MKQRSPAAVLVLGFVTLGIYSWYWAVKTKGEMNARGEHIPTAWMWLIPFVGSIWWYWKYAEGVGHVTHDEMSPVLAFILLILLGNIGQSVIQSSFNKVVGAPAPVATTTPPAASPAIGSSPGPVQTQQFNPTVQPPTPPLPPSPTPPTNPTPPTTPPLIGG